MTSTIGGGDWLSSRNVHFSPEEIAPGTLNIKKLGGPQSRCGLLGVEINLLALRGIEHQTFQNVAP
jgi:hypothetical protein